MKVYLLEETPHGAQWLLTANFRHSYCNQSTLISRNGGMSTIICISLFIAAGQVTSGESRTGHATHLSSAFLIQSAEPPAAQTQFHGCISGHSPAAHEYALLVPSHDETHSKDITMLPMNTSRALSKKKSLEDFFQLSPVVHLYIITRLFALLPKHRINNSKINISTYLTKTNCKIKFPKTL